MQTLFTSDRMIMEWKIYYAKHSHNDIPQPDIPYLYLQFIFQVNGKLTKHYTNFELEIDEWSSERLSLKNWEEWYKIFELFLSMGYSFNDECTMKKWIEELQEDDEYMAWQKIHIESI